MSVHQRTPTITQSTAKMARRNFTSWFSSSSSNSNREETVEATKKLNRRSFAGFSTAASPFSKTKLSSNGQTGQAAEKKHATTTTTTTVGHVNNSNKVERLSTSSTTQASEAVAAPVSVTAPDDEINMTALADKISRETAKLEKYLRDNNLPMPGFGVDAVDDFPRLPDEYQKSRLEIIHATKQLRDLTVGPREGVRWGVQNVSPPLSGSPSKRRDICVDPLFFQ